MLTCESYSYISFMLTPTHICWLCCISALLCLPLGDTAKRVGCWSHSQCANISQQSGWGVSLCKITHQKIECRLFHLKTQYYTHGVPNFIPNKDKQRTSKQYAWNKNNNVWWSKSVSQKVIMCSPGRTYLAIIRGRKTSVLDWKRWRRIQQHVLKRGIDTQQRLLSIWSKRGYSAWLTCWMRGREELNNKGCVKKRLHCTRELIVHASFIS